jgi:phosphate transport system substrate-binding protein
MKKLLLSTALIGATTLFSFSVSAVELNWTGCGISKKAFMSEMAKAYEAETGVKVNLSGGGATKGIRETAAGNSDIGGTCRHTIPTKEESNTTLHPVAWDALVVIVSPDNPVDNITHENLKKVFTGKITNWKDLGGPDAAIKVEARKGKISGVGLMARELIFADTDIEFAATTFHKSTGPVEKTVEKSVTSIALDGISSARKRNLKFLKLNGVEPSVANISSGEYVLFRPLYVATPKKLDEKTKNFIRFVKSAKGQSVIESQGTVTLKQGAGLWPKYRKNMSMVTGKNKSVF